MGSSLIGGHVQLAELCDHYQQELRRESNRDVVWHLGYFCSHRMNMDVKLKSTENECAPVTKTHILFSLQVFYTSSLH